MTTARATPVSRYTFQTYVSGPANRQAYAAAMRVADEPGAGHNPLLLHGGPGLGKTHLLHAIGNFVRTSRPDWKAVYTTTESFVTELVHSNRSETTDEFRRKYRNWCDVLLLDDVQVVASKTRTQEELLGAIAELLDSGRQVVITSGTGALAEGLRARFDRSLAVEVEQPDYETRLAFIRGLSNRMDVHMPGDALAWVAGRIRESFCDLEGAVNLLGAWSRLYAEPVTFELARRLIGRDPARTRRDGLRAWATGPTIETCRLRSSQLVFTSARGRF